jgi:hypothetical protein
LGNGESKSQQKLNSNPIVWYWRAMITNMDAWVASDTPPPVSMYPHISDNTLVDRAKLKFPQLAGVTVPATSQQAYHLDFGPEFVKSGIVSIEPPKIGAKFTALVPQVDSDGNDLGGIRLPELAVPLATYTGWNLRDATIGAPTQRLSFVGSTIPFAKTAAARQANSDPRPSIAERYESKDEYLKKYKEAAQKLIDQRFFIAGDLPLILDRGAAEWEEWNK